MFKTKTMLVLWGGGSVASVTVDGQIIEQVKSLKYVSSVITEDGSSHSDVKVRIAMAKNALNEEKNF